MSPAARGPSWPLVVHVRGDEPTLVRDATSRVVDELVGDADRGLTVDEFAGEDYELAAAVVAARTPPFLTEHRVVVARDLERFKADELGPLLGYLAEPEDSTSLVLVHGPGAGRLPKAFSDALKAAGARSVDAGRPTTGRARQRWLDDEMALADVRLDASARALLSEQLGEDLARLPGVLGALVAAFGAGGRLGAEEVAPFLGERGSVPPWELTDAIDRGDAALALDKLRRMLGAGGRHPLQLMVTLHAHVERWLRLHGSGATSEDDAASLLGVKAFPARKALDRASAMGGARIGRAVELLAEADLQLRGAIAWPPEQVLEVLVVRLARLTR